MKTRAKKAKAGVVRATVDSVMRLVFRYGSVCENFGFVTDQCTERELKPYVELCVKARREVLAEVRRLARPIPTRRARR